MTTALEFLDDPGRFLVVAGDLLAANPVASTVVASVTARAAALRGPNPEGRVAPRWWVVVRDGDGRAVSAGMRTAPLAPYPAVLLAMPDDAARDLARALHARGEQVTAVNGALPAAEVCADELAALAGRSVRVADRMRLYEVESVVDPVRPSGRLVAARPEDLDLVLGWFDAFGRDAAEQAGRSNSHQGPIETLDSTLARIEGGEVWLWCDDAGTTVHLTAFNPPSFGVARIGPVYTPPRYRGRGYASAAVAEISRRLLAGGSRVCLFADVANPVSCGLYERLGYRSVGEGASLVLE
jgi:predicted GNAT family acetyltransferase